jgi:HK97 family phage prohead protease
MATAHTERRVLVTGQLRIERRGEGDQAETHIVGHASVFDQWTTIYEGRYFVWKEIVRPGAFARAIKKKQDVRSLFNHDPNFVLGRTKAGTLVLSEDDKGLFTDTTAPDTQTVRDLVVTPIDRGDISGMSFAFIPARAKKIKTVENEDGSLVTDAGGERITERYEGEVLVMERELLDVDLFDVSPVTYPAYDGTDVSLRSVLGIEDLIRERDRPHTRPAPVRDSYRRKLEAWGFKS